MVIGRVRPRRSARVGGVFRLQAASLRGDQQLINFDLIVGNTGQSPYRLVTIKLSVFDRHGRLELARELNENGRPPALDIIGGRVLQAGDLIDIYQPFYAFGPELDLGRMHLDLLFMEAAKPAPPVSIVADQIVSIDVHPRRFLPIAYCLPLRGLVLIHDGHDFYSHHRRYDLSERYKADPNSALSANLYAYDFMRTTPEGSLFNGDSHRKENWLSYGEPIFAPADGIVIEAVSDVTENTFDQTGQARSPPDAEAKDPLGFGNHVKIRHADGRVSWLLHMQPGSLRVAAGERVRAGQLIGNIGFTGDSLFPHLHYNVTQGSEYPSQGVPSYFRRFTQILGARKTHRSVSQVDTGDLLESDGACR